MNCYVFFYKGQRVELIYAKTMWEAKVAAIKHFKAPKSKQHMVHGMLAEKDGQPVMHTAD